MNIVYVHADTPAEWNSSEWRCAIPARAINRTGRHSAELLDISDFALNTQQARQVCGAADVIVVQRKLFGPVLAAIQHWKARDKVVIVDFDDAYDLMPPDNPSYAYWHEGLIQRPGQAPERVEPTPLTQFKWGLRLVDGVTVPSRRLLDDWAPYANVHYLPNFIELENYQNVSSNPHEGIIIGWGGSATHLLSFTKSGILPALQNVCQARPQVKVMVCGHDYRVFDSLPLPLEQKVQQPWVPYAQWSQVLSLFDIGLAPLAGPYDQRRSWIKVLEYMVMKIPWIASEGPAYYEQRSYGWVVKNNVKAWERVLLDTVDHLADYRREAACEPYLYGIGQGIDENVDKIISVYSTVAARVTANRVV
jgi:glycosyltransferase involved in cell wall biosynthesis